MAQRKNRDILEQYRRCADESRADHRELQINSKDSMEEKLHEEKHEHETAVHEESELKKRCCSASALCGKCKRRANIGAAVIALALIVGALGWYYKGAFIAATVNGRVISRLAVMQETERQLGKDTLDNLIAKELFFAEARSKGITVSDAEVNTKIKEVTEQLKAQGYTLEKALSEQKISMDQFRKQVVEQEQIRKLLADKTKVTDADVEKYIKDQKLTVPKGAEEEKAFKGTLKSYLVQQKMTEAVSELLPGLKDKAAIKYFVTY